HTHLGVAYRPLSWLSLGVTFGNTYFRTVSRVAVSGALPGGDLTDPMFAVPFQIDVNRPFTITSNFGIRVEPIKQLAIGLSLMPPYDILASGTAQVTLPSTLKDLGVTVAGNSVDLMLHMPLIFRAGVRYLPIDRFSVEATF